VIQANKRFTKGLLFNANYTLSKSEDSGQNSTTFIPTSPSVYNPQDPGFEKGISNTDRRHRFVTSVHYAPAYLRGVQLGGIATFESGLPTTATISGSIAGATGAIATNSTNGSGGSNRSPFDPRNGFRQPGRKTIDLRVSKAFNAGGRRQLVALWEGFNVFNWVNFTGFTSTKYTVANSSYDAATNTTTVNLNDATAFLVPNSASSTLFGPRDMQVGLRFLW
jgi:hypothetical protein